MATGEVLMFGREDGPRLVKECRGWRVSRVSGGGRHLTVISDDGKFVHAAGEDAQEASGFAKLADVAVATVRAGSGGRALASVR